MQTVRARPAGLAALAGLVVLTGLLGWAATNAVPAQAYGGRMWPVGLTSGLLVAAPRRRASWLAPLLTLVALATFVLGGLTPPVAVGYAAGVGLEALVVRQVLADRRGGRRLVDDLDLVRYTLAALLSALAGATLFTLTSAVTGQGSPGLVGASTFATHLASQLIVLPFFLQELRQRVVNSTFERSLRWGSTLVVTVLAFLADIPSLVFVVLPLIGWSALRAPLREALWQLLAVATLSGLMTELGLGPFAAGARAPGAAELDTLPEQGFLLGCVLVCVPFAMAVARQRRSAAEAASERERLRRIVSSATRMAIIETDVDGRIRLFNPGAEAILGRTEAEVLGTFPDTFLTREQLACHAAELGVPADFVHVALECAQPHRGPRDWTWVRRDGGVRHVSVSLEAINDGAGAVVGYLCTGEDVTDRVQTESALAAALRTERTAVARLTEVDRSKDAFVSSVSHELRTPITNIVGYLELLLDGAYGETTEPQHEALGRIDTNSHRLLELIDDLLTLSSIESLDVELSRRPVDLRRVVERAGSDVRRELLERSQRLDLQLPGRPVVVLGDEDHLRRMVSNLASNAVKFTPHGGTITLRVRTDGRDCSIEVEDTGVGIPAEEQGHLFNRFYRSSYAQTEAVKGSGLGLSIARSIAQLHGAQISATSAPGEGSVFSVRFAATSEPVLYVV